MPAWEGAAAPWAVPSEGVRPTRFAAFSIGTEKADADEHALLGRIEEARDDADHLAFGGDERAAGVAGIHRRVELDELARMRSPSSSGTRAAGPIITPRTRKGRWPNGSPPRPPVATFRPLVSACAAKRSSGSFFACSTARSCSGARDDLGLGFEAVEKGHLDASRAHHVQVREDDAAVDDHTPVPILASARPWRPRIGFGSLRLGGGFRIDIRHRPARARRRAGSLVAPPPSASAERFRARAGSRVRPRQSPRRARRPKTSTRRADGRARRPHRTASAARAVAPRVAAPGKPGFLFDSALTSGSASAPGRAPGCARCCYRSPLASCRMTLLWNRGMPVEPWNARLVSSCMQRPGLTGGAIGSTQCRCGCPGSFSHPGAGRGSTRAPPGRPESDSNHQPGARADTRLDLPGRKASGAPSAPDHRVMNGRLRRSTPVTDEPTSISAAARPAISAISTTRWSGGWTAGLRGDADPRCSPSRRRASLRSRRRVQGTHRLLRGLRAREFSTPAWGQRSWTFMIY